MKTIWLLVTCIVIFSVSSLFARPGVMMQGFYWDTPSGWFNTMKAQAYNLYNMVAGYGIDRMWFPPAYKGQSGGYSMGYDPHDYYDLGSYNQDGSTATRFGTYSELTSCIATYKSYGVMCMEDIVLNHRSGGNSEYNPNTGGNTWTAFNNTASGKCQWHYNEFHPSTAEYSDEGTFGGYPDVCYNTGNSAGHPYYDMIQWGNWLKNTVGFNGGWRFDYVKGYHPWVAGQFTSGTGNPFAVGEYWDANTGTLDWYVGATGGNVSVFDFALLYTMQSICCSGGWLPSIFDPSKSYAAKNPMRAVTFCGNHDTDPISANKILAYAIILTYQGYPCIWWKDYFNYGLATGGCAGSGWGNGIKQLVWCREKLANGSPSIQILKSDTGNYIIYGSYGYSSSQPGYIVIINNNGAWHGATVYTGNGYLKNHTLKAYAWGSCVSGQNYQPNSQWCDGNGAVQIWAAPMGYAVYSVDGF